VRYTLACPYFTLLRAIRMQIRSDMLKKILNLTVVGVFALLLVLEGALLERVGILERFGLTPPIVRIFKETLPDVKLVANDWASPPKSPFKSDYSFTKDWFSPNICVWEKAMAPSKGKPRLRYLEIGVFEGRSMIWMLENILTDPTSAAVGVDPFLVNSEERYRANLAISGQQSRVTTLVGYSQVELRKLPLDSFDFIYIDGSHIPSDILEDAVLSLRLLKTGGVLVFDDYLRAVWPRTEFPEMTPRFAVDVFYSMFSKQLMLIHKGNQAIFLKK
jgi:hypothetical protein